MHIGHNHTYCNYYMFNQQLSTADQQRDLGDLNSETKNKQRENGCKAAYTMLWFIARNFKYKHK